MNVLTQRAAGYSALDEFLEVVFADEDFFEDAFAAVVASWDACPPHALATIGPIPPHPGHPSPTWRSRQPDQRPAPTAAGRAWPLRTARSPPTHRGH
jgi:hypothetical protein